MKISKEKARESLMDMVGNIFHAKKITNFGIELAFDGRTYGEAKSAINSAFDNITVDHPKVKLPRKVGEAWIEYVDSRQTGRGIDKLDMALMLIVRKKCPDDNVQSWYTVTPGAISILSDAYRYGWEAEPEAKWYVKTPEAWESEDGDFGWLYKSIYGGLDTTSHGDCGENEQFTRVELKTYHLDSGIFTLVPVGDEK